MLAIILWVIPMILIAVRLRLLFLVLVLCLLVLSQVHLIRTINVRARVARVRTEFDKSTMKCAQEYRRHLCRCSWALHYWLRQTSTLGSGAFDTPVKSSFLFGRAQFYVAFIRKALGSDN